MTIIKTFSGYHIGKSDRHNKYLYISRIHKDGGIDYTTDYTYARTFSKSAAESIILKLQAEV